MFPSSSTNSFFLHYPTSVQGNWSIPYATPHPWFLGPTSLSHKSTHQLLARAQLLDRTLKANNSTVCVCVCVGTNLSQCQLKLWLCLNILYICTLHTPESCLKALNSAFDTLSILWDSNWPKVLLGRKTNPSWLNLKPQNVKRHIIFKIII